MSLLLEQLGIRHPLCVAPMAGVSTPELAAEVSNQGGLGALGLGAHTLESARSDILKTQALTDSPFQVNFFCHQSVPVESSEVQNWIRFLRPYFERYHVVPPTQLSCIYPSFLDHDDYLNLVLETRPKAVSFHFGLPHPHQLQALHSAGILTLASATNLVEARQIEAAGIDFIVAQGIEAGGHRGIFNPHFDSAIRTVDLVQLLTRHCTIPVIAAGGIMNGLQARTMLKLGASAVQLGTAFVQCKSSNASPAYRQALFCEKTTQISASISGRPARGLFGYWHSDIDVPHRPSVPAYPYAYDLGKQLHAAASKHGDQGFGAFWAGSNVSQIRAMEAADLMNQLLVEMQQSGD